VSDVFIPKSEESNQRVRYKWMDGLV